jgi:hypothetical protein
MFIGVDWAGNFADNISAHSTQADKRKSSERE